MRRLQRQVGIYAHPSPNQVGPNPNHVDPNPSPHQVDIYVEVDNNGEQPRLRRPEVRGRFWEISGDIGRYREISGDIGR